MRIKCNELKLFAFSDTHGMHEYLTIPSNQDVLICSGDVCITFDPREFEAFVEWYREQPARLRLFVWGNHEMTFCDKPLLRSYLAENDIQLIENEGLTWEGIHFYSLPARVLLREEAMMPIDVDFLLTHAPMAGVLDEGRGCSQLREAIETYKPKYHLFGHAHREGLNKVEGENTTFINVSYYEFLYKKAFSYGDLLIDK